MKWITNLWNRIIQSDNQPLLDKIKFLENKVEGIRVMWDNEKEQVALLVNENTVLQEQKSDLRAENFLLKGKVLELEKKNNKHLSLETFKEWFDKNIIPKKIFYAGRGSIKLRASYFLKVRDYDKLDNFIKNITYPKATTADSLIYGFVKKFHDKYPTRNYYGYDKDVYNKLEYWASPEETIDKIKTGTFGDCDDVMILLYACLERLLKQQFPKELWRLKCFIVDLWTGGGHAMLGWVKKGVNDFIPVETTYYDTRFVEMWKQEFTMRNNNLYRIRFSFDSENEYVKI